MPKTNEATNTKHILFCFVRVVYKHQVKVKMFQVWPVQLKNSFPYKNCTLAYTLLKQNAVVFRNSIEVALRKFVFSVVNDQIASDIKPARAALPLHIDKLLHTKYYKQK